MYPYAMGHRLFKNFLQTPLQDLRKGLVSYHEQRQEADIDPPLK